MLVGRAHFARAPTGLSGAGVIPTALGRVHARRADVYPGRDFGI